MHHGGDVGTGQLGEERGPRDGIGVGPEPEQPGQAEQRGGAARDGGADERGAGEV
nr:hypothetical protein GCM10025730_24550 [Promicromonospora thailandica]